MQFLFLETDEIYYYTRCVSCGKRMLPQLRFCIYGDLPSYIVFRSKNKAAYKFNNIFATCLCATYYGFFLNTTKLVLNVNKKKQSH